MSEIITITVPWADAVKSLKRIQEIVHQKTARTEPAIHHFQRDFDEIRQICENIVGSYKRADVE